MPPFLQNIYMLCSRTGLLYILDVTTEHPSYFKGNFSIIVLQTWVYGIMTDIFIVFYNVQNALYIGNWMCFS